MKRREFFGCAAAVSTAFCTTEMSGGVKMDETKKKVKAKCKITVIKKDYYPDLYQKYTKEKGSICTAFKVGQEFLVTIPYSPPKNFCSWAWADIRPSIHSVFFGGRKSSIVCCTDGLRPVVFNVERVG